MTDVLEQFELSVGALGEHRGGEGLHDLLDGHRSVGELVICRANETESTHSDGSQVDIAGGYLEDGTENGEFDKVGHLDQKRDAAEKRERARTDGRD